MTRDPRNAEHVRVTYRDEAERLRVKEAAAKVATARSRLIKNQLYPIKLNNAFRPAVLTLEGNIQPEVAAKLGEENRV